MEDGPECVVCARSTLAMPGTVRHDMDSHCFHHALTSIAQSPATLPYWQRHRGLKCAMCDAPLDEATVFASRDVDAIRLFVDTTRHIACSIERLDAQRQAEKAALEDSEDAKKILTKRILSEIDLLMTTAISCAHCKTPFFDFNGCLALTCESCSREFCGICMKHHAIKDGHQQVAECMQKLTPEHAKEYGFHGSYFISAEGWKQWKEKLKTNALYDYARTGKHSTSYKPSC